MIIELDEYIPLRFRTYKEPPGCGYLRMGDYSYTLMDLKIEPISQVVRGLTLTSVPPLSPWPRFEIGKCNPGLPALSTSFEEWGVVDLNNNFQVSVADGEILVYWSELTYCEACHFGEVDFLIQDELLSGIIFRSLDAGQLTQFLTHFTSA